MLRAGLARVLAAGIRIRSVAFLQNRPDFQGDRVGVELVLVEGQSGADAEPERQAPTFRDAEARTDAQASELRAYSGTYAVTR